MLYRQAQGRRFVIGGGVDSLRDKGDTCGYLAWIGGGGTRRLRRGCCLRSILLMRRRASVHSSVRPLFSPAHPCTVSNGPPLLQALTDSQSKFAAWYGSYHPHPRAVCRSVWLRRGRCFSIAVEDRRGGRKLKQLTGAEIILIRATEDTEKNKNTLCTLWFKNHITYIF